MIRRWFALLLLVGLLTVSAGFAETLTPDTWSDEVRKAQTQLAVLGYYSGEITGHYGQQTQEAMAEFRRDFDLGDGGEADDETLKALYAAQYRPMQIGTTGPDVKRLQARLMWLGYYGGKVSGNYLSATGAAVKEFQTKMGLSATGSADIRTQEELFSDRAVAKVDKANATPAPEVPDEVLEVPDGEEDNAPTEIPFKKNLAYESTGSQVKLLQQRLTDLGYYAGPISGNYLGHTRNAVKAFQQQNALNVTGKVDKKTWNAVFNDPYVVLPNEKARTAAKAEQPAFHMVVDVTNQIVTAYARDESGAYTVPIRQMICSSGTTANPSDRGDFVLSGYKTTWCFFPKWGDYARYWTRINSGIAFHSVIYNTVDTKDLSVRSYDRLGRRASHGCIRLQVADAKWIYDYVAAGTVVSIRYDLPADAELKASIVKPALNKKTMLPYETPQPTQEPVYVSGAQPPMPLMEMKKNDSSTSVYWLQKKLTDLGYYTGKCSGTYLDGTVQAVKAFQQAHGIRADGVATLDTLRLIYAAELAPVTTPAPQPMATPEPTEPAETLAPITETAASETPAPPTPTPKPSTAPRIVNP